MNPLFRSCPPLIALIPLLTLAACGQASDTAETDPLSPAETPAVQENAEAPQQHKGIGVVVSFMAEKKFVNIDHETIPNFMDAMTMPFEVKDTTLLQDIQEGDSIIFRFTVADGIQAIEKVQ